MLSTRRTRGSVVVEMALVMPLLLMLVLGITQYGITMFVLNNMTSASRDVARRLSVDDLTLGQADAAVKAQLVLSALPYKVTATTGVDCVVTVTLARKALAWVDILGFFQSGDFTAKTTIRHEE